MKKVVVFVIFMASTAFGQNAADVVVSNSVSAHGGASRISALRTIVVSGQITERGLTEPLAITASLDGYVRWDYGTTPRSIITTPKHRFEIFDGRASYRPPHVGAFAQFDVLAPVNLARLADAGTQRTLQSTAIVQSRFANVVQIDTQRSVTSSGMTIRDRPILYVDTVTNLISGIVRPQFSNRIQVSFVDAYLFADYRRVDNLLLPFYIERYIDGVLQQILEIQSIQINPAIDSHIFDLR